MSTEQLYLIVILFIIVSGVVLLNDKIKSQKQKQPKSSKRLHNRPHNWKFLFAAFALIISIFLFSLMQKHDFPDILKWAFFTYIGIVLLIIIFVFFKSLWKLSRALFSGKRLLVAKKHSNGTTIIKCPNCYRIMRLNEEENRFECSHCDESLTFMSDPK